MYVYGGQGQDKTTLNQLAKLSFDEYGTVHYEIVNSNGPKIIGPRSVIFSNNDSVAIIGTKYYEGYHSNITDPIYAQVYSFSQNTWTAPAGLDNADPVPPRREGHTAVKAANGLIYIHGGSADSENNVTYLKDSWSYDPIAGTFKNLTDPRIGLHDSTATVLPDGRILYVGGSFTSDEVAANIPYPLLLNESVVYNPDSDSWTLHTLNNDAIADHDQFPVYATSSILVGNLGSPGIDDKYYNILWILDTHTWVWSVPPTAGILPRARIGSSIGRINNEYVVLCFGTVNRLSLNDIDVLKLPDMTGNNSSNKEGLPFSTPPEWVQNIASGDTYNEANEKPTSSINIRFCLQGNQIQENTADESTDPPISCTTSDGIPCNDYLTLLDLSYHQPRLGLSNDITQCYLFRGESADNYLAPLRLSPISVSQVNNGTSLGFSFQVSNTNDSGKIYISFYHPERDPNPNIYFDQRTSSFNDREIEEWTLKDASRVPGDYLESYEVAYIDYQLELTESLTDSKWNYFGFASQYNSTPEITTTIQKYSSFDSSYSPTGSIMLSPASFAIITHREQRIYSLVNALGFIGGLYGLITAIQTAMFGYRPQSPFGIIHHWSFGHMKRSINRGFKDQFGKYKSPVPLINPVHSRHELLLYNNMQKQGTPEEQNENQKDDIPNLTDSFDCDSNSNSNNSSKLGLSNEKKQFTVLNVEENSTQCNSNCQHCIETIQEQARQIELIQERTQLLEHLFKSYYVNDEVFKKVDTAIKQPERSPNQQHSSNSFLRRRRIKKSPERRRLYASYHNTTSSDSVALVSNSSATNSNHTENGMIQNNNIENGHH
ncbi:hypothetical protein INT45_006888 [Circinella minor]|uniref:Attractin/MKLN-like beta-propeller domain-containing protein n=1 Tax=Circinella minor TaxID=1195481 RepID=A0A8H7VD69_9FUNG|nr:hypothetical protein INT45_006888 [Circinella minor]